MSQVQAAGLVFTEAGVRGVRVWVAWELSGRQQFEWLWKSWARIRGIRIS